MGSDRLRSGTRRGAGRLLAGVLAAAAVTFTCAAVAPMGDVAGAVPAPRATLQVAPANDLEPGAEVAFVAAGLPPGLPVRVEECAGAPGTGDDPGLCTPIADSIFLTAPDGSVRGTATVITGPVGAGRGGGCPADPPAQCAISLQAAAPGGWSADAPISFSPDVPRTPAPAPPGAPVPPPRVTSLPTPSSPPTGPVRTDRSGPTGTASPGASHASRWTFGLVGLLVAGVVAGAGRARVRLRRAARRRVAGA
jgi:hypothetical protein